MTYKPEKRLDDKFNSADIENRCLSFWEGKKVYAYDPTATRENTYIVDTPPPTVSGSLHIGHIFSYTQTDIVVRFQRMLGKSIFYPIGWDDNGLATERRVQNYYNIACNPELPYDADFKPVHDPKAEGERKEISRQNFIEACSLLTGEDEKAFDHIFHQIGHSYDWDLHYTTIGKNAVRISQSSFVDLAKKGHAALIEAPTMWDTTFKSAVATAEIEDRETDGFFHDINFGVEGEPGVMFTIATTRPEFLPACIAVVAHPDDERYKKYFGKKAIVPIFDIPVPIVPSEHAEMDKGTGIMMVCTFGDAADVAWWKQSNLPVKQIIGLDGRLLAVEYGEGNFVTLNPAKAKAAYDQIAGLKVKQARAKIVEFLRAENALIGEPKPIKHPVKFYEKGDQPLEFVTSRQWFIKILEHKQELIDAGRQIKWYPSHMQTRYETWVEGLNQEWCISRQRFFGVPFPVWYPLDKDGNPQYDQPIFADEAALPVDPMTDVPAGFVPQQRDQANGFTAEKDVMDTWATSSLTPQLASTLANNETISLPFDIRPQAHDIIRTWAFYTVAKAWLHEKKIPWKEALISGFILDPDRKKMSKSKGNVVTPIALLEKYSSDAVRYWAGRARLGIDTAFEEQIMEQGKKLAMKLFNASKFVFNIAVGSELDLSKAMPITNALDKSWQSRMAEAVEGATSYFNKNDYAGALEQIEHAFWDFCDNYLEIVKGRAYGEDNASAVASLMKTIDLFATLFAPFCPFTAEEIYQCRPWSADTKSVHNTLWPKVLEKGIASDLYTQTVVVIEQIRKAKAEAKKSLRTPVKSLEISGTADKLALIDDGLADIKNAGNVADISFKEVKEGLTVSSCILEEVEALGG